MITKEQRMALYEQSTKKWGEQAQIDQIIEEMAELIVALNKYKRMQFYKEPKNKEKVFDNLFVELADVSICLEQMIHMFGESQVEAVKQNQLEKFRQEIEKP